MPKQVGNPILGETMPPAAAGRASSYGDVDEIYKIVEPFLDSAIVGYPTDRKYTAKDIDTLMSSKYLDLMRRGFSSATSFTKYI